MQSALPKRWRGLKAVETALLGGRGPHRVILAGLRPANMKDRASRAGRPQTSCSAYVRRFSVPKG